MVDGQAASEERDDEFAVALGLAVEELALAFYFLALFGFLQAAAFLGGLHLGGVIDRSACHGNSPVRRRANAARRVGKRLRKRFANGAKKF